MALTKCKECKKEVSNSAKICPHCGIKNPGVTFFHQLLGIILIMVILAVVVSSCSDDDKQNEASETVTIEADRASGPKQYETLRDMFEDGSDFYPENGTLVIESENPAIINVGTVIFANDLKDVIDSQLKRALIYGAIRPFIHTDLDKVTVTAFPVLTSYNPHTFKALDAPSYNLTITREASLKKLQKFLDIKNFDELVTQEYGTWTAEFNNLYYEDKQPGLDVFFNALTK
ncbi:hypothetical protein AKN92_09725 [Thiopseudomonas alkaliphila]|nr:hypothetical protein AKN92_09725 [Thiopseudomonas alkaliphila]